MYWYFKKIYKVVPRERFGHKGYVDQAVYGTSKWAFRGFSKNLQEEFKGKPNRVISFCPGGFKSKLFEKATGVDNTDDGSWMNAADVAIALKQTLDLPKNVANGIDRT